ncbi:MAG: Flp pilus assembly complex ATPase component TadA [Planctomycetia bacterium]|nr:Flp pilus assembly complex ATPase component TadA [Planctomycetia bacterium]
MKVWYNKIHDSRRTMVEIAEPVIHIGRDANNTIVLQSPLVSKRHAIVTQINGKLRLENVGINGCMVGESEVLGGQSLEFSPGQQVRIWPFSLTFEAETASAITRVQLEAHLRSIMADLELRIHKQLLERLDLYELESNRVGNTESILLLENNIEDICRELNLFGTENAPLLEEVTGLTLRDYLVNKLILEGSSALLMSAAALFKNEFDIPATLVAEREAELHELLRYTREKLNLDDEIDLSGRIQKVESQFATVFPLVRPHLHNELRKYLILRTLKKDLKDTVFGFGPLQDLIRAPTINEIMVVKSDLIYVEREGVLELSGRRFISDKVTESIIERIVAQVGRRIDKSQPLVDARLPDGSRVNAIIPPLAIRGPCLTIRKFPAHRFTMDDLVDLGSMTASAAVFLRACVIDRKNILVSGGTGTGKTTMLNVLSSFIPHKERIVTIEDTTELQLHQDHVVTLETKQANVEGAGAYTIRDLVKNALRMRPDRIIVGECRGPEAVDMLQAMNTGHDGSMTTVHANSSEEVIKRLEVLVLMAVDLPVVSIHRQIASAIDVIVQITRMPGGKRIVTQVSEVSGIDPETKQLIITDIYNYRDGRTLHPTGYLPSFVESLIEKKLLELKFLYGGEAPAAPTSSSRGAAEPRSSETRAGSKTR